MTVVKTKQGDTVNISVESSSNLAATMQPAAEALGESQATMITNTTGLARGESIAETEGDDDLARSNSVVGGEN